jgi:uncharacterized protein
MSQENLDVVRRAYEAMNAGDMGAFLGLLSRDVEWKAAKEGTDPGTYSGHTGVGRFYDTRLEVWDQLHQQPDQLIDRGESVVAVVRTRTRGKASGVELEQGSAHLWQLRDGKVVRFETFDQPAEALAASGIRPARTAR